MAREGLNHELAVALLKALRSGERVVCRNLRIGVSDAAQMLDLTVQPIDEPANLRGMALVVFSDVAAQALPQNMAPGKRTTASKPA